MRALLLMADTGLAASLEKFLAELHGVEDVTHVTDVGSARLQLASQPTDWFVVEPDSVTSDSREAIQELLSSDHEHVKRIFVIAKDIRWSTFCKMSNNVDFLPKPFTLTSLNERLLSHTSQVERRNQDRVYLSEIIFGQILLENNQELDIVIRNVSPSGCLLHVDAQKTGLAVYDKLTIYLPHEEPIMLTGEIVRVEAHEIEELPSNDKFVLVGVRFIGVDSDTGMLLAEYVSSLDS